MFINRNNDSTTKYEGFKLETGWDPLDFFTMLVVVEHVFLILKIAIEYFIEDVPAEIARGERDRKGMIDHYMKGKG